MTYNDLEEIKKAGFTGFKRMSELFTDSSTIPKIRGVYLVLNLDKNQPEFLEVGSGGHFKKKNPNVSISELKENWIDKTIIVYVGKAGKEGSKATLQSRLKQYLRFGQGAKVGHWGGRLIWQLKHSKDLIVCWKPLPTEDPRAFEAKFIQEFSAAFSSNRPFANLTN